MMKMIRGCVFVFLGALLSSVQAMEWQALPDTAPAPADNPTTPEKVELGQMLFMDPRFSSTGTVSCNSCHNVMLGGEDNRPVSMGVHGQTGGRSAPTVWNSGFNSAQFWDGRAATLEDQARGPVVNPVEMGMGSLQDAISRVRDIPGYQAYFKKAFGGEDPVTVENAARAVAAYERTLITPNSPYDRYAGGEKSALSGKQIRGMNTFASVGCTTCHSGAAFNGPAMQPGSGFFMKFPGYVDSKYVEQYRLVDDKGRFEVTGKPRDSGMWKVPTLRNVALTAPYFHNGLVKTLDEAVRVMAGTQLDKELNSTQVEDIVAFLNALTGEFPRQGLPQLPPTPGRSIVDQ